MNIGYEHEDGKTGTRLVEFRVKN